MASHICGKEIHNIMERSLQEFCKTCQGHFSQFLLLSFKNILLSLFQGLFFSNPDSLQGHTFYLHFFEISVLLKTECSAYNVTGSPFNIFIKGQRMSQQFVGNRIAQLVRECFIFMFRFIFISPAKTWMSQPSLVLSFLTFII